jgi:hypothetical protein
MQMITPDLLKSLVIKCLGSGFPSCKLPSMTGTRKGSNLSIYSFFGTLFPLFGCLAASATQGIWGEAIWNPRKSKSPAPSPLFHHY